VLAIYEGGAAFTRVLVNFLVKIEAFVFFTRIDRNRNFLPRRTVFSLPCLLVLVG
jgi:hypothetical protein